jgi:hypothetical protein
MQKSSEKEVERYLRTGEHDAFFCQWPGEDFLARAKHGNAALRTALISTVRRRTKHATAPKALVDMDVVAFARTKVAPMVRGLFPRCEHQSVLDVLGRSVVFLTPATIDTVLAKTPWLSTAWDLANLYLASFGAALLSEDAPQILGLSEEMTCYVSAEYFRAQGRFDDFVVHEAAHIFHNCKRRTMGLRELRGRDWLLEIDFIKRETFAYACETYSRILELGEDSPARRMLLSELEKEPMPAKEHVDASEYIDILREAVVARNGWKRILERCSPSRQPRRRGLGAACRPPRAPDGGTFHDTAGPLTSYPAA